jgi:hypothetical protein
MEVLSDDKIEFLREKAIKKGFSILFTRGMPFYSMQY